MDGEVIHQTARQEADVLKTILNSIPDGVIVADLNGKFLFSSAGAEKILGNGAGKIDPAEWTTTCGCYLPDQVTPLPPDRFPLVRAMRGEEIHDEIVFIKNGHLPSGRWITASGRPLRNADGSVRGGVMTFRDITERRQSQQRVKLYERLCTAVEQTADSVLITDREGRIEYVNPAFEVTTGYGRDEALGQTPRVLKSGKHDAEFYRDLWITVLSGRSFKGMIVNKKKTGELYWAQQTITPMKDDEGRVTHFVTVLRDVTELLKKQEQEVEMRLAREVQQRFYRETVTIPGFDIGGAAYPADQTGGDYFDFIPMPDGCLGIAVGDVSGHGLASALMMAETRAYLRSYASTSTDVAEILTRVNRAMEADLDRGSFVTLFFARLDPKSRSLVYANAGHIPSGHLLGRDGEVESTLVSTGPPLGLLPDYEYTSSDVLSLNQGQILLLMTDGVTETLAPEDPERGETQAIEYVIAHRQEPARQIAEGLYQAIRAQTGNQPPQDDITSVILKVS